MYTIGQFSRTTGLSVKALRHYDEAGLLRPDRVDRHSGYRHYAPAQVRAAATISLLRSMEVPLPTVREVLAAPDRFDEILAAFVADRAERRAREDATAAEVRGLLAAYDDPAPVRHRDAPEQPWVGADIAVTLEDADDESAVAAFNEAFGEFLHAVTAAGLAPLGPWWLEIRPGAVDTAFDLRWGVPVAGLPSAPLTVLPPGAAYRQGTDPAGREAVVDVAMTDDGPTTTDLTSAPHPAVLALLESGIPGEAALRQVYVPGPQGMTMQVVARW